MLHVVLLILKILGILLLSILGLLLLVLCAALFVPVRYRLDMEKQEQVRVTAKAGWLFRFLFVKYELRWPEEEALWQDLCFRILGIPVFRPFRKKKKKREKPEPKAEPAQIPEKPQSIKTEPEPEISPEPDPIPEPEPIPKSEAASEEIREPAPVPKKEHIPELEKPKISLWERICRFFRKLADRINGIGKSVQHLGDSIRNVGEKKDTLVEFWNLEEHVRARKALIKEASYLWKRFRPRKIKGTLHFGLWDPAATGILMGMLSMLYAWYPEDFMLDPDFDQLILKGELHIKGHIRLYPFCLSAWRIWRNKDVRLMYKHWKHK